MRTALVFERNQGEAIAPDIYFRKGAIPEFDRCWIANNVPFQSRLHVDAVELLTICGVSIARPEFGCVCFRLSKPAGVMLVPSLCFNHAELVIAIHENVIGNLRLRLPTADFDPSRTNMFSPYSA